ncbi:MAG: MlaD family protein [Bacteroidota bacterium]|jgi:phospholipid/cholesterol/gamma-HCH transport system substrate-binding protein
MNKNTPSNIRLGLFVSIGTLVLVVALYLIGSKQSLFSSTIRISSQFYNVNGLMQGNNVRYAGIDIGTVDKIRIENDSSVSVYMVIEKKHSQYIKKNATASVGTDGLMGNKLVNINPGKGPSEAVIDGDVIASLRPVETDEMIRTLNATNDNLEAITTDLRSFTARINTDKGLLRLIEDSVAADNIRVALQAIREASVNANKVTLQIGSLAESINKGEGLAGVLIKDPKAAQGLKLTVANLEEVSDSLNKVVEGLSKFTSGMNNPNGLVYKVNNDSVLAGEVKEGVHNLKQSTELLNENLKAMRSNFLFRKYFKQQEKKSK